MKKIFGILFVLITVLMLVGCSALDPLSQFERVAATEVTNAQGFNDIPNSDLDDENVDELSYQVNQIVSLSVTLDLSNQEKIDYVKTLFQSIRETHLENVAFAETTKASWDDLKVSIQTFRDEDKELLPDDKETLILYRDEIRAKRTEVRDTFGDIQDLFEELRGNYKIENLDLIIQNLEEVLDILELRQEYIVYLDSVILDVNSLVIAYNS